MKTTGAFRGTDGPNPVPPARSLVRTRSERFDRLYEEERTQVQVIPRVFRRLAEAAEQRRKPQPTQTVYAPRLDGMVRREYGALGTLAFGVGPRVRISFAPAVSLVRTRHPLGARRP